MDRQRLRKHKKNKAELVAVNKAIDRLQEKLSEVETISGKVTKSSDDFPYIEEHLTVKVTDPKKADPLKMRIRDKEKRKAELEADIREVETFIAGIPEGVDREIFEMVYLDGFSQADAGENIGYTQSMVSKVIKGYLKDS